MTAGAALGGGLPGTRKVLAGGEQLEELLTCLDDSCVLTRDLCISESRLHRGVPLVAADDKLRGPIWRCGARQRWAAEVRSYIQEAINGDAYIILCFEVEKPQLPWCIISRYPCCVLLTTLLGAFALIAGGFSRAADTPQLDTDMSSFMEADGAAALRSKAFLQAKRDKADTGRRLGGMTRMLHLTYVPAKGQNLLTVSALAEIRQIEDKIRSLPGMQSVCEVADPYYKKWCDRGASLANFVYPRLESGDNANSFHFDGTGRRHLPLHIATDWARDAGLTKTVLPKAVSDPSTLATEMPTCRDIAMDCTTWREVGQCAAFSEHEAFMQDFCAAACGYCDEPASPEASGPNVEALRSYFVIISSCCSERWEVMLTDVAAALEGRARMPEEEDEEEDEEEEASEGSSDSGVDGLVSWLELASLTGSRPPRPRFRILYGGTHVKEWEALQAIVKDMNMAAGACLFVLFYATVHTRSPLLAFVGLFLVLLSLPMALAVFCLATGSLKVSMMVCLSVFIVVGIGSDMVFVYTDFWKQSAQKSESTAERLKHTYLQAASSTAATTFTTMMSFMANLASPLRPLREFGFIMGTCVGMAWLIILLAYPPVLVLTERCSKRFEARLRRFNSRMIAIVSERSNGGSGGRFKRTMKSTTRRASAHGSVVLANMVDPHRKGVGAIHSSFLGSTLTTCISTCRITIFLFFVCFTMGVLWRASKDVKKDTNVPEIFRNDHNQFLLQPYEDLFEPINPFMNSYSTRKSECDNLFRSCSLHRCRTLSRRVGSSSSCVCMQQSDDSSSSSNANSSACYSHKVDLRIVGRKGLSPEQVTQESVAEMLSASFPDMSSVYMSGGWAKLSYLNTTHWESGREYLASIVTVPQVTVYPGGSSGLEVCSMKAICYCNMERCEGFVDSAGLGEMRLRGSGSAVGSVLVESIEWKAGSFPTSARRLSQNEEAPERSLTTTPFLAQPTVPMQNQVYVNLVLGIKATGQYQTLGQGEQQYYAFDPAFVFEDPWVQRMTLELCYDVPENLQITRVICWLGGFAEYWLRRGEEWPLRPETWDVHKEVLSYVSSSAVWMKSAGGVSSGDAADNFAWFSDTGKLQAMYFSFNVDMTSKVSSTLALKNMQGWDAFVGQFNGKLRSKTQATWQVWHTCSVWVRAEADKVILDSTIVTIAISMGCVLLGVLLFTRSLHLALIVTLVVLAVIFCLFFFMVSIMGWAVGAVEVLCLIIFVGFAVDYCFHIAHKYHSCHVTTNLEEEKREEKEEDEGEGVLSMGHVSSTASRTCVTVNCSDTQAEPTSHTSTMFARQLVLRRTHRSAERLQRTRFALERMGGSVMGSAITTIGCAFFLLPCNIAVFMKIGAVVCAVSFFAVVYALLALPAVLMLIGPCGHDFTSLLQLVMGLVAYMRPADDLEEDEEEWQLQRMSRMGSGGHLRESARSSVGRSRQQYLVLNMPTQGMAQIGPRRRAASVKIRASG